uniref:N-acetyltransferase domain-containing protein n=1 Tax=viral metagenome TaxID=1070528 RepID=A0A6M3L4S2_9ZZZZ
MKDLIIENRKELDEEMLSLIQHAKIGEEFDVSADYKFIAKYKDKLVGIIVYRVVTAGTNKYPRFIHIIFHPDYKRSKVAYVFARETEKILARDGYIQTLAYIKQEKAHMRDLAEKFGYEKYAEDDEGKFYCKTIGGRDV